MVEKIEMASVSYTLGILSIVMAFFTPLAGLVFGIVGLVQANKQKSEKAKKLNIIGIILSSILFIISILLVIYSINSGLDISKNFPIF